MYKTFLINYTMVWELTRTLWKEWDVPFLLMCTRILWKQLDQLKIKCFKNNNKSFKNDILHTEKRRD